MGFVVLHMEKAHGSDSGTTAHIERFLGWIGNWHVMSGRFLTLDARRAAEQRRWLAVFPPVIPSVSMCQKRP